MPTDAGVDQRRSRCLDSLGERYDLVPGAAAFDEIEHRQAKDDDEIRPGYRSHATDRLEGEAASVLEAATPAVLTKIGLLGDELVDQITLRPHHLDAVVAGGLGKARAPRVVADGPLDVLLAELARSDRRNWCLHRRRCYRAAMVGVTTGMEDLHGDLAASLVDCVGDLPVLFGLGFVLQHGGAGHHDAVLIGSDAAGNDQTDPASSAFRIERSKTGKALGGFFEAGMHRPHKDTILQPREAEVERGEQVWISVGGHSDCLLGRLCRG